MKVESALEGRLQEIFEILPFDRAMSELSPFTSATTPELRDLILALDTRPEILAGLWLYVDELGRSHEVSQAIDSSTGSYWHAIMHRREGDFGNSKYWLLKTGDHPVICELGYVPTEFVDECESDRGRNSPKLIEQQRREWKALFDFCVREATDD